MKKILLIVFLLLIIPNVKALKCEYTVDRNNFGLIITVGNDVGVNAFFSNGYYISPGYVNYHGGFAYLTKTSDCPEKAYYACNEKRFCRIDVQPFLDSSATLRGVLELKTQSSGDVIDDGGSGEGGGSVYTKVKEYKPRGDSCGAIKGISDLIDRYVKIPLLVIGVILFLMYTSLEYAKVVFSGDASSKKANQNTLKRALGFGLLALSPYIINLLLRLAELPICE